MSDESPWTAYANTVLVIGRKGRLEVDLRQRLPGKARRLLTELGLGNTFAIVTASNPGGRDTPLWQNWWRHRHMRAQLRSRGLPFVPADGQSPDGAHRERGFAIAMGREDAAALALELDQLALYWFDGSDFWIDAVSAATAPRQLP